MRDPFTLTSAERIDEMITCVQGRDAAQAARRDSIADGKPLMAALLCDQTARRFESRLDALVEVEALTRIRSAVADLTVSS